MRSKALWFLIGAVFGAAALAAAAYLRHRRRQKEPSEGLGTDEADDEDPEADFEVEEDGHGNEVFVVTRGGRTVRYASEAEMPERDRQMVARARQVLAKLAGVFGDSVKVTKILHRKADRLADTLREESERMRAEVRMRSKTDKDLN